jgi:polyadenylate-binding protein
MWSQRDPGTRRSGKGNIFIKNLSRDIDNKTLFDTFTKFGNILSCKIELDETNQSKGYGYIQYSTADEADLAVQNVNGMMIADKKVFVGPFVSKKERQSSTESSFTNVFIKNLPETVGDGQLYELFAPFGMIKSAIVMKDEAGRSKLFGFVNFDDPNDALEAVTELNNKEVDGKPIFVGRAQKKMEREAELKTKFEQMQSQKYQGVNLYIKNLDDDIDDEKLLNLFSPFGTITSAKIMKDGKGSR